MATSSINKSKNAERSASATRENAKKQEAELKKKQAAEINKLQKAHGEKIRELQKNHEAQLEAVRVRGQESLSEKDKKYQNDIEKIKNAHTQQTKSTAQNYDRQIRQMQDDREGEGNKIKQIHESQMESLSKNYKRDMDKKDETFTKAVDDMRSKQSEALSDQKERLESRYQKDSNILRDAQDKKINQLSNQLQNVREQKNAEIKSLKVQNFADREKLEADKLSLLTQERKTQEMHKDHMRDQYGKNLDEMREKYGRYNSDSRAGRALELENMKTMAEQKNNQQVNALERRIREMRAGQENENFVRQKTHNEEKKAYLNATKEALEKAELQRSQVYDAANERTKSEINSITNRNAEILDRQGKYYQSRIGEMEIKYDESIDNQVKTLEVENRQDKQKAEMRQAKLSYLMNKEKNDMENYYKEILNEKDRAHKDSMVEQRMNMLKERNEAVNKLENRIREIDAKNTEKMNQLIMRYEREVNLMKDEHKAEKKRMTDNFNIRFDELNKNHKFQLESEKLAAKSKEDQLKARFERNISQMELKHDEEKIRMATVLKK